MVQRAGRGRDWRSGLVSPQPAREPQVVGNGQAQRLACPIRRRAARLENQGERVAGGVQAIHRSTLWRRRLTAEAPGQRIVLLGDRSQRRVTTRVQAAVIHCLGQFLAGELEPPQPAAIRTAAKHQALCMIPPSVRTPTR